MASTRANSPRVTGTTEMRPRLMSAISANARSDLMAASETGSSRRWTGSTSTTTQASSAAVGSG